MPRTAEDIVANHRAAAALRAAGKPIWAYTVDMKRHLGQAAPEGMGHNGVEHIVHVANAIAKEFRARLPAKFFDIHHDECNLDFMECIERMELISVDELNEDVLALGETPVEILDGWLDELYDHCDRFRIWTGSGLKNSPEKDESKMSAKKVKGAAL